MASRGEHRFIVRYHSLMAFKYRRRQLQHGDTARRRR
jgi:hypothetical protein